MDPDGAKHLVDLIYDRAETNGLEWLILTEHGTWLGFDKGFYDHGQAVDGWRELRVKTEEASRKRGTVALLIGEEIGQLHTPAL